MNMNSCRAERAACSWAHEEMDLVGSRTNLKTVASERAACTWAHE
jgi:hypothetical protein